MSEIKFSRVWAMPSSETFSIKPIGDFVKKYLIQSKVSVDPFARNCDWSTYTNDLNHQTAAQYHLEAEEFCDFLVGKGVKADLLILDWPYSPRQIKECYDSIGRKMQMKDGQTARLKKIWRLAALPLLVKDSVVLTFGWSTNGMGKGLGFEIIEILLVASGGDHADTICMAERKMAKPKI
jgi:hypothetical protein